MPQHGSLWVHLNCYEISKVTSVALYDAVFLGALLLKTRAYMIESDER